jgi:putative hydrolase of the HAD superfamily
MFTDLKPKVILFDFYETLLDILTDEHDPVVWEQLARFLQYRGLAADGSLLHQSFTRLIKAHLELSKEKYPEISISKIFRAILSDLGYSGPKDFYTSVSQLFRSLSIRRFGLFSDTLPTLQGLARNYQLGLITDAQRVFFESEIQITGLKPYFNVTMVSSDYPFHKPDPRMFMMALEKMGAAPDQVLFVGDSWERDILGAWSVGIRGILLNRKNHHYNFEGDHGPLGVISSLNDLRQSGLAF